jgi:hypothetical protein
MLSVTEGWVDHRKKSLRSIVELAIGFVGEGERTPLEVSDLGSDGPEVAGLRGGAWDIQCPAEREQARSGELTSS